MNFNLKGWLVNQLNLDEIINNKVEAGIADQKATLEAAATEYKELTATATQELEAARAGIYRSGVVQETAPEFDGDFTTFMDLAQRSSDVGYNAVLTAIVLDAMQLGYEGKNFSDISRFRDPDSGLSVGNMAVVYKAEDGQITRDGASISGAHILTYGPDKIPVFEEAEDRGERALMSRADEKQGIMLYASGVSNPTWESMLGNDLELVAEAYMLGHVVRISESGYPQNVGPIMKEHGLEKYDALLAHLAPDGAMDPKIAESVVTAYRE